MPWVHDYELLDFGQGRKLERFADRWVLRPCPAAESVRPNGANLWLQSHLEYDHASGKQGGWTRSDGQRWPFRAGPLTFWLAPTPAGQVGLFPEQLPNWEWLHEQLGRGEPASVLNLFAYTGGSTLAAAAAGAQVVHVDASRPVVQWARQNAALSNLEAAPIRWIVDDARRFVARELRRARTYQGIILDPPSYGHGARGEAWQLARDLPSLLADCVRLLAADARFLLLTCHTPGFCSDRLRAMLLEAGLDPASGKIDTAPMHLISSDGRRLFAGQKVCWQRAR